MKSRLQSAMKDALRQKNKVRLETIRGVLSAIQYQEMQKGSDSIPDNDVVAILKSELKKRDEELEFATKGGRSDLFEKLNQEVATIKEFLPQQLSEAELEKIISGYKGADPGANVGVVMKLLKEQHSGQYDGKLASEVAKRVLG